MSDHDHSHESIHSHEHDRQHNTHGHSHAKGHAHTHGAINPSILINERGIWAVKWSFIGLLVTTLLQEATLSFRHDNSC